MKKAISISLALAVSAMGYVPNPYDGPSLHRLDYPAIQFYANQNIVPGLTNASGALWITPDSSPMTAISNAVTAWNGVTTTAAHFLPVQTTMLSYNPYDGNAVIVFVDDSTSRSVTGGVVAFTDDFINPANGVIADSDIFFSPNSEFSTTGAAGTYDIQSVLTHELGHAMGANHTNVLSATMFYAMSMQDFAQQTLAQDDIAFVSALYPPASGNGYGTIVGAATVSGNPLLGGAITAVDPSTGITIGGFSSITDGSFSFQVPPGNYYVYVEPAAGLSLYSLNSQNSLFTSFQSGFVGGNSQPSIIPVQAGVLSNANPNATAGLTALKTPYAAIGAAGQVGDLRGTLTSLSLNVASGQSVDFVFSDPLPSAIAESNIQLIGPAALRTGSLRKDIISLSDGTPIYRFTVDIPPFSANAAETMVFRSGTDIITRTGVLNLTRPQAVNAGSFVGGPVAPGEILSFFGSLLGPASPVSNGGFDSTGTLPKSLGGIGITFDQTAAPLFYVSNNQINLQVPYEIAGQASTFVTVNYNGAPVATSTLNVAKSAPGIFVVTNVDGSVNGPNSPSSIGATLVIYGTGAGVTTGLLETGQAAPANSTIAATVTIGGKSVTPAFAGLTPGSVGLTQVNVTIPAGTPTGTVPMQYSMNGSSTQTVNIYVR